MILGVDPGARGALAWSTLPGYPAAMGLISLAHHDLNQLFLRFQAVSHLVPKEDRRIAFLEENTGFIAGTPRTGSSMFTFGRSTGRIEMALAALGFELYRVRPAQWQKALGCPSKRAGETSASFKGRLASFAREIAPEFNARITRENADALLILRYGINTLDRVVKNADKPIHTTNSINT